MFRKLIAAVLNVAALVAIGPGLPEYTACNGRDINGAPGQ